MTDLLKKTKTGVFETKLKQSKEKLQYFNSKKIGWLNLKSRWRNWNKGKILDEELWETDDFCGRKYRVSKEIASSW